MFCYGSAESHAGFATEDMQGFAAGNPATVQGMPKRKT
jgi:hypothetical protein